MKTAHGFLNNDMAKVTVKKEKLHHFTTSQLAECGDSFKAIITKSVLHLLSQIKC